MIKHCKGQNIQSKKAGNWWKNCNSYAGVVIHELLRNILIYVWTEYLNNDLITMNKIYGQ